MTKLFVLEVFFDHPLPKEVFERDFLHEIMPIHNQYLTNPFVRKLVLIQDGYVKSINGLKTTEMEFKI